MTVFNYFPRKEELFLDRVPEAVELVTRAIRDRAPGQTPLTALRLLMADLTAHRHPLSGIGNNLPAFWQTVLDSPALRAYTRESLDHLEGHLAALLTEEGGDELRARYAAALGLTACRTVFTAASRRILAGEPAGTVADGQRALADRVFRSVECALAEFDAG